MVSIDWTIRFLRDITRLNRLLLVSSLDLIVVVVVHATVALTLELEGLVVVVLFLIKLVIQGHVVWVIL